VSCGFQHGSEGVVKDAANTDTGADADDASMAGNDATLPGCYQKWFDNTIRFNAPTAITEINVAGVYDRDPFLMDDELTVYLSSDRPTSMGTDIWTAKRTSLTGAFSAPEQATPFNSTVSESKLSITQSNTIAVVGSDRPGSQMIDVWDTLRANTVSQWPAMQKTYTMALATAGADHDPTISSNGLRIYLAPFNGTQIIAVASRTDLASPFGAPAPIDTINGADGGADPSPTPDERILLFSSHRPGGAGVAGGNLWYATRASATATFSTPLIVPDVNTGGDEGDAHLSSDGCRIYFARHMGGVDWDIYVATAMP
jgi:hypothetical protein